MLSLDDLPWRRQLFFGAGLLVLILGPGPGESLLFGIAMALLMGNPFGPGTKRLTQKLLAYAVVGLGGGMNLLEVARVGVGGLGYTLVTIGGTVAIGFGLGRALGVAPVLTSLVSAGTAICGGSAIAAVAPVVGARDEEISVSLAIVFMLNALALAIFPPIGRHLQMDPGQFGLWSALAIHDTSSVVGATLAYAPEAVKVGTTVKLARALWIVPVTLLFALYTQRTKPQTGNKAVPVKKPWFILGFLAMAGLVTWVPQLAPLVPYILIAARHTLMLTLFLIGSSLSRAAIGSVGVRPFALGVLLWLIALSTTLVAVVQGVIHL